MNYELLISYGFISLLMGLIPGPSVLFTAAYCLKYNFKSTLISIAGQLTINILFTVIVFIGIDVLPENLLNIAKIAGSLYIIYLGYQIFQSSNFTTDKDISQQCPNAKASYLRGALVCLSNPKLLIHLGIILPQFLPDNSEKTSQLIMLCIISFVTAAFVLFLYAYLALISKQNFLSNKNGIIFTKSAGILMIFAGFILFLK